MDSFIGDYIDQSRLPWTEVSSITKESDLAVINLETSVSTRGQLRNRKDMACDLTLIRLGLVNSGIDLVSLAKIIH